MLYCQWLRGATRHSQAAEVPGIEAGERSVDSDEWLRRRDIVATFHAIILYEREKHQSIEGLSGQYDFANLEGMKERRRYTMIWLLTGLASVPDIKFAFFHHKKVCAASDERVNIVKHYLTRIRMVALASTEQVKCVSPLGGMLLVMKRRGQTGVGTETLRWLDVLGITKVDDVRRLCADGLVVADMRRTTAKKFLSHMDVRTN